MTESECVGGYLLPGNIYEDILKEMEPFREQIYEDYLKALEYFATHWEKPELIKVNRIWVNPPEQM